MEAAIINQKRKVGFISFNNNIIEEKKRHANLGDFLKGTIYGDELVKYVCDRLDEKYSAIN